METAIVPGRRAQLPGNRPEQGTEMTACRIAGLALGAVVLGLVLSQIPDMIRYMRMSQM